MGKYLGKPTLPSGATTVKGVFSYCRLLSCSHQPPSIYSTGGRQEADGSKGDSGAKMTHQRSPGWPPRGLCHALGHRDTSETHWREHTSSLS